MLEVFIISMTTFFATVGPLDVAVVYAALTTKTDTEEKQKMAMRGVLLAGVILFFFALFGEGMLVVLGISLPAFSAAGGILLLLIGIEMVFARHSGASTTTSEEQQDVAAKNDISVFPIAMPLIAGPGSMGATVLLIAKTKDDYALQAAVLGGLAAVLALTYISMRLVNQLQRFLGVTGMHVISRIFGILLTALAVQFIFDGIAQSGLLKE